MAVRRRPIQTASAGSNHPTLLVSSACPAIQQLDVNVNMRGYTCCSQQGLGSEFMLMMALIQVRGGLVIAEPELRVVELDPAVPGSVQG